jgi:carboxyl-terminal processing protease
MTAEDHPITFRSVLRRRRRVLAVAAFFAAFSACDGEESSSDPRVAEMGAEADDSEVEEAAGPVARASAQPTGLAHEPVRAQPAMPGAKAAFTKVAELLDEAYVDGPLSEDELWTGAMEGVLARLVQLEGHRINELLSPQQLQELVIGTKGKLVGVGIMIERVADVVVVRDVVAESPAQKAGLQPGDRILGIDGERIGALELSVIVDKIRGEDGTTVDLFVQRDTEEWTETITRGQVEIASVQSIMLDDRIGYLQIGSFGANTAAEVDTHLQALQTAGMKALVLDLRGCPGGLLDASLHVADRFLPPGAELLVVEGRDGAQEVHKATEEHPWQSLPLTVLIGKKTASGAEILADALHHHGRATLVGERTMGKHTVEAIHELGEGWAIKFSIRRFRSASGEARHGVGVAPQIRIPEGEGKLSGPISEVPTRDDPALEAARELLEAP